MAVAERLRLGTRGSALARAQANLVVQALAARGAAVEVVIVRTAGDEPGGRPIAALGRGVFVKELEAALRAGAVDLAVHSAKDLPTGESPGLRVAAVLRRGDPRDALVSRDGSPLAGLRRGAVVGTDSPRRRAFLLAARPDLAVVPLRGNVDTRLRRLEAGACDAVVLAAVGLDRLGWGDRITERLDPAVMPPAPGQGALAVQVRAEDRAVEAWVRPLDDPATAAEVRAERAFLQAMGGGCRAPIAALARVADGRLVLQGAAVSPDGRQVVLGEASGPPGDAAAIGVRLARHLLAQGAGALAAEART
jgi:hydroxymethylbilane synthase